MWMRFLDQSNLAVTALAKGNLGDVMYLLIDEYKKRVPRPNCIVFNLPRSTFQSKSFDPREFFIGVELVLDGELKTGKYKGAQLYIQKPHVFLLTNENIEQK